MNKQKHTIFGFVGASGSGKTTLMIELLSFFPHLSIIKSTTTRSKRDDTDDLFYKFVDLAYIESPTNALNFLSQEIYSNNHYIYEKTIFDEVITSHCGMLAILEHTVPTILASGYNLKLIKIIPDRDWELDRTVIREKADSERESLSHLKFDFVIQNSFKSGGLDKSVQLASGFIANEIAHHFPTTA